MCKLDFLFSGKNPVIYIAPMNCVRNECQKSLILIFFRLDCPHDDEEPCVNHQSKKEWHTMGPSPDETSDLWSWSECSRRFITDFIK